MAQGKRKAPASEKRSKTPPEAGGGESESTSKAGKQRRSHGQRAAASLRSAKRTMREVSDEQDRARYLLAEANVLALLDLADALRGKPTGTEG